VGVPFALRRPVWLVRDLIVDREEPDLARLAAIEEPERFVWAILPHAARTFSACIALLPMPGAEAAAVAYLYCRMLDTYEDLLVGADERDAALAAFAGRFDGDALREAPAAHAIDEHRARDGRDAGHLLLVRRHALVDRVYATLDPPVRALIATLVREMAAGMRWSSRTFERQGGVLEDEDQLLRYCRHVIGEPVLFVARLLTLQRTGRAELAPGLEEDAMRVGEMVQLANVTRDIEKDLHRGIAYHPLLRADLGRPDAAPGVAEKARTVRRELLRLALVRVPSYRRLLDVLGPGRLSLARASALLMLLFTDRYFRGCARRAGLEAWGPRRPGIALLLRALPAAGSRRWAGQVMARVEADFLSAAEHA